MVRSGLRDARLAGAAILAIAAFAGLTLLLASIGLYGVISGLLLAVAAAAACWLPTRWASRVDPILTLRAE